MPNLIVNPPKNYTVQESWQASAGTYDLHAVNSNRITPNSSTSKAQFTVNAGDKYNGSSGERAEIVVGRWNFSDRFKITGNMPKPEFYKVSCQVTTPWEVPDTNQFGYMWGIFFQVHGPDSFNKSPNLALHVEDGFHVSIFGGNVVGGLGTKTKLLSKEVMESGETTFVVEVLWRTNSTGYVRVYAKTPGQTKYSSLYELRDVPTLQWSGVEQEHPHYIKYGLYRSESDHTNSVTVGELIRSSSFPT